MKILANSITPADTSATVEITDEGVKLPAKSAKISGNNETIISYGRSELAHYDVNFSSFFKNNPNVKLPDTLYGKGFQVYCATCPEQWFNFNFTGNVIEGQEDKPELEDVPDVKNIFVDISSVTDPSELVETIANSANPQLATIHDGHNQSFFGYDKGKPQCAFRRKRRRRCGGCQRLS